MGCGSCSPREKKEKAVYECIVCGKVETKEAKEGEDVKSCCGQPMKRK